MRQPRNFPESAAELVVHNLSTLFHINAAPSTTVHDPRALLHRMQMQYFLAPLQ